MIKRRKTRQVKIGKVKIGAGAPISIQSMTKTDTADIAASVSQIKELEKKGCEIIRVAVKSPKAAQSIKKIKDKINIPIVADIHFDYKLALESIDSGCDGIRLNPGNIKDSKQVAQIIRACKSKKIPIRIGLNTGSAGTKHARGLVNLAKKYLNVFEREKFYDIIISLKASDVYTTISAYRKMSRICDYPFHLGVTASGMGYAGIIKSAVGIGALLAEGIGDTIRVSLTDEPAEEVLAAKHILQSLNLRRFYPEVISCPTCGRCQVDLRKIVNDFSKKLYAKRHTLYANNPKIALMGCEVNGPGEAKHADIGIAFGKNCGIIFKKGKIIKKVVKEQAVKKLLELL